MRSRSQVVNVLLGAAIALAAMPALLGVVNLAQGRQTLFDKWSGHNAYPTYTLLPSFDYQRLGRERIDFWIGSFEGSGYGWAGPWYLYLRPSALFWLSASAGLVIYATFRRRRDGRRLGDADIEAVRHRPMNR